jgi:hypothetical protein
MPVLVPAAITITAGRGATLRCDADADDGRSQAPTLTMMGRDATL